MARLPYVDPATAPDKVREILERLPADLNVFRMMAHAETSLRSFLALGTSILSQQKLSAKLRELAILRVASLSRAEYEWVQHVAFAKAVGVTDEQVEVLERGAIDGDVFDDEEKLVLRFVTEVVEQVRARDDTMEAMKQRFSPREIVELILATGYYMTIARLLETTGVDLDDAAAGKFMERMKG